MKTFTVWIYDAGRLVAFENAEHTVERVHFRVAMSRGMTF